MTQHSLHHLWAGYARFPASADLTGDDSDVYTFRLAAGSSYIYQAAGDGLVTATGMFKSDRQPPPDMT